MTTTPDFSLEAACQGVVCGVDEAGRGPWAGPVVAAAVILRPDDIPAGIHDSKQLKRSARETIFEAILNHAHTGVGVATVAEIDALNILQATLLAMRRAVETLLVKPDMALVDGNRLPDLPCDARAIVKGDSRSLSIAAASIVAKVTRDRLMEELGQQYPMYGFEQHAGYGTPAHQHALAQYGVTPHHRRSFAPIRALLAQPQKGSRA